MSRLLGHKIKNQECRIILPFNMIHSKRATVEVQFNWIFVLIAGGLILALFSVIVIKQKDAAQSNLERTTLRTLKAIIAGSSASTGTSNTLELPKTTLTFECNTIYTGERENRETFLSLTAFSPHEIKTPTIVIDTKQWSIPFNAGAMLYITSPKMRYIVIGQPSPLKDQFCRQFPKDTYVECKDSSLQNHDPSSEEQLRFIFFNQAPPPSLPPTVASLEDRDVSALAITFDPNQNSNILTGRVQFYIKSGQSFQPKSYDGTVEAYPFLGMPSLLGAAYAFSPAGTDSLYECVMNNALKRAKIVTQTQIARVIALQSDFPSCQILYSDAINQLSNIENSFTTLNDESKQAFIQSYTQLETKNKELQRASCPLIY